MRETAFQVGDRVALIPGTMLWTAGEDLREKPGDVTSIVFDGTSLERITIAYDGVVEFEGMYAGIFDRARKPAVLVATPLVMTSGTDGGTRAMVGNGANGIPRSANLAEPMLDQAG